MSRVALVYPYFRTHSATELLFPPLGAASLKSQLNKLGIETRIFDCTFRTFNEVLEDLHTYNPDLVGMYSMMTLTRNAFRFAEAVRSDMPNVALVAGGPMPTLYPEQYAQLFDAVFCGEADLSFPDFCRDLIGSGSTKDKIEKLPLASYPGMFLSRNGTQIANPPIHHTEAELETFPVPSRDGFDHPAYQKAWFKLDGTKTTSILTTLGCPFSCDFCSRPVFGNLFRRRNLDLIFEEVEQIRNFGYDSLWIADDNFTLDIHFLADFCARIAYTNMKWSCLSRVTGITRELAKQMKVSGCRRVYLGMESGDEQTLKIMNKRATLEEGRYAVYLFHEVGIEVAAFFIVGYPGETKASIEKTLGMALELPLNYISFNVPFPLPGSPLFKRVGSVDAGSDWMEENEIKFVYESEFDPEWLKRRIAETMSSFARLKRSG